MKLFKNELNLDQRQTLDIILWAIVMMLVPSLYVAFLEFKRYVFFVLIALMIAVYCLVKNNKKGLELQKKKQKKKK